MSYHQNWQSLKDPKYITGDRGSNTVRVESKFTLMNNFPPLGKTNVFFLCDDVELGLAFV